MKRRDFLKNAAVFVSGASLSLSALEWLDPKEVLAANPELRWAFLVNTHNCVGCGFCVKACKVENEIPMEANVTRTWVERYVIKKDGKVVMDTPKGALNGFTNKKSVEVVEILLEIMKSTLSSGEDLLISGFGKFQVRDKSDRLGRNPATGDSMVLKGRRVVTFKCSGKLRDRLNGSA